MELDPHNQPEILLSESDHAIRVVAHPSHFKPDELDNRTVAIGTLPAEFDGDVSANVYLRKETETFTTFATVEMPAREDLSPLEQFEALTDQLAWSGRAAAIDKYRAIRPINQDLLMVYMLELQADGDLSREVLIYPVRLGALNNGLGADNFMRSGTNEEADVLISEVGKSVSDVVNLLSPGSPNTGRNLRITLPRDEKAAPSKELVPQEKTTSESTKRRRAAETAEFPSFSDFGGLDAEIGTLLDFVDSLDNPLLAEHGIARPGALLLEGPGGVGKTALVQALAKEIQAKYIPVRVSDIAAKFVGEPVKNLRQIFNRATSSNKGKVILFFDEFDGLFKSNSMGNEGVAGSLITELKTILNTSATQYPNLIVVAATNSVDGIAPELLRPGRFDTVIKIPVPGHEARYAIFANMLLRHEDHFTVIPAGDPDAEFASLQDQVEGTIDLNRFKSSDGALINIDELAINTEGLTGADIKNIIESILRSRLQSQFKTGAVPTSTVTHAEMVKAIQTYRTVRPSTN